MVFSILGVLAGGAFLALMISASSMLSDPTFFDLFAQELQSSSSGSAAFDGSSPAATYDYSSMNEEQIREAATLGINVVIALAVGYMLLHVVGIVASSMSLRALAAPEKLRRAFGWTVAAAVCAAVVFSIITCVCFIIAAWMNARVRKSFAAFAQGGYPGPGMYQGTMPGQGACMVRVRVRCPLSSKFLCSPHNHSSLYRRSSLCPRNLYSHNSLYNPNLRNHNSLLLLSQCNQRSRFSNHRTNRCLRLSHREDRETLRSHRDNQ